MNKCQNADKEMKTNSSSGWVNQLPTTFPKASESQKQSNYKTISTNLYDRSAFLYQYLIINIYSFNLYLPSIHLLQDILFTWIKKS